MKQRYGKPKREGKRKRALSRSSSNLASNFPLSVCVVRDIFSLKEISSACK